ncbi:transcription factor bHLH94 [Oryza sativa Japonica Group]|uniref:Basic-helix-loop-helix (BHLH)transcription factor n=2 Tax=Oryza sativa subsp. japonica TaxID=39947 RepID=A0A0P0XHM7_ORYSJ|eukprot:NP_001062077.1 Os08g0483900 [Oryza sativa Japonica Group]
MALEAVVFSEGYYFGCGGAMAAEAAAGGAWSWSHGYGGGVDQGKGAMELVVDDGVVNAFWDGGGGGASSSPVMAAVSGFIEEPDGGNSSVADAAPPPEHGGASVVGRDGSAAAPAAAAGRRKRRRARTVKNREEVESQRMTHIAVERNRRKQMNEYLAVLRSLMPASYVQRGDQASIIGGAINYVKEMEQLLQSLEAHRHARRARTDAAAALPFAGFFTFPQYSMSAVPTTTTTTVAAAATENGNAVAGAGAGDDADADVSGSKPSSVADIEVTMVESHANLKVLSRRRPRQLLRMVAGLQHHRLAVLHLNVASAGHMALYSLSLKVEEDCQLTSVDDIAAAVHGIVETIEQEQQQQQKQSCS